jgi:UDP-glucose 6-dehydrogenase
MELTEAIIVDTISKPTKIAIVGTGYVGMACVIGFAEFGHRVVGYDIMTERVHQLQRGVTPYRSRNLRSAGPASARRLRDVR